MTKPEKCLYKKYDWLLNVKYNSINLDQKLLKFLQTKIKCVNISKTFCKTVAV